MVQWLLISCNTSISCTALFDEKVTQAQHKTTHHIHHETLNQSIGNFNKPKLTLVSWLHSIKRHTFCLKCTKCSFRKCTKCSLGSVVWAEMLVPGNHLVMHDRKNTHATPFTLNFEFYKLQILAPLAAHVLHLLHFAWIIWVHYSVH